MVEKTTDLVLHVYLTNNLNIVSFFFSLQTEISFPTFPTDVVEKPTENGGK